MTAEIGLASLWMAAMLAMLTVGAATAQLRRPATGLGALVRPLSVAQGALSALAFLCLIRLFLASDMSVALVARHSHSDKPWLFKFAGTWGNHEGSMLLWVTVLCLSGALVALTERRLRADTLIATLGAQALLALGFFAFLLLSSNPFTRLDPAPPNGVGLNPVLQDVGLAFHPPTLYIGYVGLSVAFSFAVGALVTRDVGSGFARAMRPWVLLSWVFLTIGIVAGSYWAYYELGWGGWWFWDPVENVSLVPWLAATALFHSASVTAARDALRAWTVMLAVVAFSMSMVGTFIVRSGLLTSVHSFAVDPTRGAFLLALMAVTIGGALLLFALRVGTVAEGKRFAILSREGMLVVNNLLLVTILAIVLIGTLYPIAAEAMGDKVSVGPPWFDRFTAPFALALGLAMVAGPLLRWRRDDGAALRRWIAPIAAAGAVALGALLVLAGGIGLLPLAGLVVAAMVAAGAFAPLIVRLRRDGRVGRLGLPLWGMMLAHLGVGVTLAGMAADSAFTRERLVAARPGEVVMLGDWTVAFRSVAPVAGPNWTAVEATLIASRGGATHILKPQSRLFIDPETETNEAALRTSWDGQLYAVMGHATTADGQPRWQLRLWWKPFVWAIWVGGLLMALGGAVALVGHVRPLRALRRWTARRHAARVDRPIESAWA